MVKAKAVSSRFKKNLRAVAFALAIVLFWRGTWGLADLYLFPENEVLSLGSSALIGLLLIFLLNHHKIDLS